MLAALSGTHAFSRRNASHCFVERIKPASVASWAILLYYLDTGSGGSQDIISDFE